MTVEQQVDALTASVDNLKGAVVSKKATLDASVADAQSATAQAQSAKVNALSARDEAEAFKDAAYTAALSAASAVAYQDLSAVALTKAVTAVDVFIYDTSKDSDGGAWRHRCAGKSWHREPLNTATRGARREFPAVAVLVLEKGKLTIYDGDDPDLPMWMVINGYSIGAYLFVDGYGCEATSIAARNGALVATGKPIGDPSEGNNFGGALIFNFVSDTTQKIGTYGYNSNYGTKNGVRVVNFGPLGTFQRSPVVRLPNGWINDVAMTVLPDAQENPSTGLPELTLAFATKGGVALLRQDGSVTSSAETLEAGDVVFNPSNELISGYYAAHLRIYGPVDKLTSPIFSQKGIVAGVAGGTINVPFYMSSFTDGRAFGGTGSRAGLTKLMLNSASIGSLCVAAIASSYTTGWMPGAAKGAFLADTDDIDLVGATVFDVDFSSYANQAAAEADGWVFGSGWSLVGGQAVHNGVASKLQRTISNTPGQTYLASVSGTFTGNGQYATLQMSETGIIKGGLPNGAIFGCYVANDNSQIFEISVSPTGIVSVDAASLKFADADRSVNNKGLIVNGTVTRSTVATGAELVAYSGFSASNYLEQPYNSALDFGTGDFCVMGWAKWLGGNSRVIVGRGEPGSSVSPRWLLHVEPGGSYSFFASGTYYTAAYTLPNGAWAHVCAVRTGGVLKLYLNGIEVKSAAMTADLSNANATLRIGLNYLSAQQWDGGISLVRIAATAPSSDQIRRIYEDEKALFQENAACTLYGASDAVTALAHDTDAGLLHVGTSAGRSVFKGLRRVANTTTPVATAIAAAGDLVVEQ
ncbi:LamG domain-containing protein [Aliiroseovarius sp. xm-v-208]|uniref:LamG domain-containing protein n=1 Tax=Aliiroseovarius sp. xm-v-208 TaxID=2651835 RepID=UPI001568A845|nr:hypothetical protein [Aliiroseovarius sp. xm-v-208]